MKSYHAQSHICWHRNSHQSHIITASQARVHLHWLHTAPGYATEKSVSIHPLLLHMLWIQKCSSEDTSRIAPTASPGSLSETLERSNRRYPQSAAFLSLEHVEQKHVDKTYCLAAVPRETQGRHSHRQQCKSPTAGLLAKLLHKSCLLWLCASNWAWDCVSSLWLWPDFNNTCPFSH